MTGLVTPDHRATIPCMGSLEKDVWQAVACLYLRGERQSGTGEIDPRAASHRAVPS